MKRIAVLTLFMHAQLANAQLDQCKAMSPFLMQLKVDPGKSYFSTSEKHEMGLMLLESTKPGDPSASITKRYQHPSWKSAGYLGAIATDEMGNLYVLPTAKVNMLHNPLEMQNSVYMVDATSGVMQPFISLPGNLHATTRNPFGTLGSFYDCSSKQLFVSTVAGSDERTEVGKVYALDVKTKKLTMIMKDKDIYGLALHIIQGKRVLFLSSARTADLYSLELDQSNHPAGSLTKVLNIEGLGPRGDDRIRKIRFLPNGNMVLYTVMFYYNLTAPSEEQQSKLTYQWIPETQQWKLTQMQ